jgi:hypothetical protein
VRRVFNHQTRRIRKPCELAGNPIERRPPGHPAFAKRAPIDPTGDACRAPRDTSLKGRNRNATLLLSVVYSLSDEEGVCKTKWGVGTEFHHTDFYIRWRVTPMNSYR